MTKRYIKTSLYLFTLASLLASSVSYAEIIHNTPSVILLDKEGSAGVQPENRTPNSGPASNIILKSAPDANTPFIEQTEKSNIRIPANNIEQSNHQASNLKQLSQQGNAEAALKLGFKHYSSKKKPQNYGEAYRQFKIAADSGDGRGILAVGYCLIDGLGVTRNPQLARNYLTQAKNLGYARASYLLSLLEKSIGTPQAKLKIQRHIQDAVAGNDAVAANALANEYLALGETSTARLWYERAMDLGSRAAGRNLERISQASQQQGRVKGSIEKLKQASVKGDADSSYILAVRYHRGLGVPVDFGQALRYYRLATQQGNASAAQMLSLILSRSTPAQPINAAWMQELSRTMSTPAIAVDTPGTMTPVVGLDDPLEGLMSLSPR